MLQSLIAAVIISYPAAGDRGIIAPPAIERSSRVEMVIDRGPILEMIIRCQAGTAIVSYSKIERLYCTPKHVCSRSRHETFARSCR
jgi:hypothetical protein